VRVFLETNVLASAVATRGICAQIGQDHTRELVDAPMPLNCKPSGDYVLQSISCLVSVGEVQARSDALSND
jgi:hypothetical protein